MSGARIRQECLALGAPVAGGALGGTSGALSWVPVTSPDFLMIGAPKAGTTALPASPRTGGRIAKVTWTRNSPAWMFDEAALHRATVAPGNPGYVDVELHCCRYRLGFAPDHPPYQEIEQRLAALPAIAVPAVTPGGMADANFPAADQQPVQPPPHSRRSS